MATRIWVMAALCAACATPVPEAAKIDANDAQVAVQDADDKDAASGELAAADVDAVDAMDAMDALDTAGSTDAMVDAADVPADVTVFACKPKYEGVLPGAHVDLSTTPCVFSISQGQGGFELPFHLVVESSELLTPSRNSGQCAPAKFAGGVGLWLRVQGNSGGEQQLWCQCDTGPCFFQGGANADVFKATQPGTHASKLWWDGKNFQGASDTGQKPGKAFPPGEYLFRVQTDGKRKKADGTLEPYAATASLPILLLP